MANTDETTTKKRWCSYLNHLCRLAGIDTKPGKPDLGALAELRNSARGAAFEIRALRHIVPYLEQNDTYHRDHVRVAMLVGQLFAAYRPDSPTPETDSEDKVQYRSLGWLLGEAEAREKNSGNSSAGTDSTGEGKRNPTALERHLYTVVAADFDRLGPRLRGTLARLKKEHITPKIADYGQLLNDLDQWMLPKKDVQYNWVKDFYSRSHRSE